MHPWSYVMNAIFFFVVVFSVKTSGWIQAVILRLASAALHRFGHVGGLHDDAGTRLMDWR